MSRLTTATNPESGSVSYSYDANSNLLTKTDARPVTTTYTYDELNRVTLRDYSDTTPDVSYVYDPAIANGKGRLSSVTSSMSSYNYTQYDALGRVTAYNQQTAGQLYLMGATYNKGGLMMTESYPSGKVIETQYDSAGRIAGVKKQGASGFIAGAASSDAVNRLQYTAHGAVKAMKLGNGLWEHVNFNSRLQPTQIGLGTSSTTSERLQLDYGYGTTTNNGNVVSQTITAPGLNVTQTYSYDQVNRLLSATETNGGGQTWQQVYGYDVYGNRWVNASSYIPTPALTPQSQSAFSAATNRIVLAGFNYDLVGNVTKDPTTAAGAMVYDAENRQVSYTKAGATTSYSYDGDGRRVKKVDSAGTTVFVYNAAGQLIAEYVDANQSGSVTMSYLTADHLGSTRVVTDGAGLVKARHDYLPFGEELSSGIGGRSTAQGYSQADGLRQKWTGKERDGESGLDYFLARYCSSAQARFTSPDPLYIEAKRWPYPQSWNLYAYTRNNPLKYIDPDGLEIKVTCANGQLCDETIANLNNRKNAQFKTELKDGKLAIVGKVDASKLSKSERSLYNAITDTKNTAELRVVASTANITFGQSALVAGSVAGSSAKPEAGLNIIDGGDVRQLNKVDPSLSGEVIAHEALEAYVSVAEGLTDVRKAHARANEFFGNVTISDYKAVQTLGGDVYVGQAVYNFGRIGIKATVEKRFITPIPAQALQSRWDAERANIRVVPPK